MGKYEDQLQIFINMIQNTIEVHQRRKCRWKIKPFDFLDFFKLNIYQNMASSV